MSIRYTVYQSHGCHLVISIRQWPSAWKSLNLHVFKSQTPWNWGKSSPKILVVFGDAKTPSFSWIFGGICLGRGSLWQLSGHKNLTGCGKKISSSELLNGKEWKECMRKNRHVFFKSLEGLTRFPLPGAMVISVKEPWWRHHRYLWNEATLNPSTGRLPTSKKKRWCEMLLLQVPRNGITWLFHKNGIPQIHFAKKIIIDYWSQDQNGTYLGLTGNPRTPPRQEKSLELPPVSEEWALDAWKC